MEAFSDFLGRGGYGGFIWPSYGLTFVILVGLLIVSIRALRRGETVLGALRSREEIVPREPETDNT